NPPALRVGYLSQGLDVPDDMLVRDVLMPGAADLRAAEAELERLAVALSSVDGAALDRLSDEYAAALERVETLSAQADSTNGERILAGLGLADVPLDWPAAALSGGQKTRLGLAALLARDPQLLILD